MKIACIGDNCIDYYDATGEAFPGGNPVNVAVYLRRLGVESAYFGAVGTDIYGRMLLNRLQEKGVDISHVQILPGQSPLCHVSMENGNRILGDYSDGVMEHFRLREEDFSFLQQFDMAVTGLWGRVEEQLSEVKKLGGDMGESRNRKKQRERRNRFIGAFYAAVIYAIFYIPVLVMIQFSFNDAKRNYSWEGFTTMWYGKLFSFRNHDLWESLVYSVIIAVIATVISVVIGVLGGIGLKKFRFRGKKFINLMLYVPIVVPEIVLAVAMLIIFMTVGIKLGMGTIVIGHCTFCIPYAVVTIKGRISGDNETLQEASMDLGANRVQTFWRVTIPSIMPGIMSAAFLSFTLSIDDVIMSNMLASARQSTLPVLILSVNRTGITPDINQNNREIMIWRW